MGTLELTREEINQACGDSFQKLVDEKVDKIENVSVEEKLRRIQDRKIKGLTMKRFFSEASIGSDIKRDPSKRNTYYLFQSPPQRNKNFRNTVTLTDTKKVTFADDLPEPGQKTSEVDTQSTEVKEAKEEIENKKEISAISSNSTPLKSCFASSSEPSTIAEASRPKSALAHPKQGNNEENQASDNIIQLINLTCKLVKKPITNLGSDLKNGVILLRFLERLTNKRIQAEILFSEPETESDYLVNLNAVFSFLTSEKCCFNDFTPESILKCNEKLNTNFLDIVIKHFSVRQSKKITYSVELGKKVEKVKHVVGVQIEKSDSIISLGSVDDDDKNEIVVKKHKELPVQHNLIFEMPDTNKPQVDIEKEIEKDRKEEEKEEKRKKRKSVREEKKLREQERKEEERKKKEERREQKRKEEERKKEEKRKRKEEEKKKKEEKKRQIAEKKNGGKKQEEKTEPKDVKVDANEQIDIEVSSDNEKKTKEETSKISEPEKAEVIEVDEPNSPEHTETIEVDEPDSSKHETEATEVAHSPEHTEANEDAEAHSPEHTEANEDAEPDSSEHETVVSEPPPSCETPDDQNEDIPPPPPPEGN